MVFGGGAGLGGFVGVFLLAFSGREILALQLVLKFLCYVLFTLLAASPQLVCILRIRRAYNTTWAWHSMVLSAKT